MPHIVDADVQTEVLDFGEEPSNACDNYERCRNEVPHNGKMCGDCLDQFRWAESSYGPDDIS